MSDHASSLSHTSQLQPTPSLETFLCQVSHPFHCCIRLSSSNSFKLYQFLPRYLLQLSFCCPLCCFRRQAKCTENTGKTSNSSFLWHGSQEGQLQIDTSTAPVGVCDTLFFQFFSNSKPLKHFLLETKYCELKSDNRLEYQMYFVIFSEAA